MPSDIYDHENIQHAMNCFIRKFFFAYNVRPLDTYVVAGELPKETENLFGTPKNTKFLCNRLFLSCLEKNVGTDITI